MSGFRQPTHVRSWRASDLVSTNKLRVPRQGRRAVGSTPSPRGLPMVMAGQQPETKQAMTKAVGRKLKVFQASLGFYATVVAAPSQAAALRAWGIRQNLFGDGVARPAEDEKAVEVA